VPADLEFPSQPPDGSQKPSSPINLAGRSSTADLLRLTQIGTRVHVSFSDKDVPDESRVEAYRIQLVNFIQRTSCRDLTFDLEGIKLLPSRMLGFFLALKKEGRDIELVNVSPFVQDIFRVTKLDQFVTIRGGN
jgi:anti-anti-sigma factor